MAIDYEKLAQTALRLISTNGRSVTLRAQSTTLVDPDDPFAGTEAAEVPEDIDALSVTGVFTNFKLSSIDGVNVIAGDKRFVVADSEVDSEEDLTRFDRVHDGSDVYQVVGVDPVQPGDTPLVYFFHVRRLAPVPVAG